jgi:hypothetical protein
MAKLMGPFTPFLAEYMYQILRKLLPPPSSSSVEQDLSVHFQLMPKSELVFLFFHFYRKKPSFYLVNLW